MSGGRGGVRDLRRALDPVVLAEDSGITPDKWQRDLLRGGAGRVLINAARQSGKSTVCGVLAAHTAAYHPKSLTLLLSPTLRQSGELFKKARAALPVKPEAESALRLEMFNGSRIVSLPGKEATVRGFSAVNLLVVDEASRVPEDLYRAIRPMLSVSGGKLVALSTPAGRRGWWFEEWTDGGPHWERYEVPASEVPRISEEFLEEERRSMPKWAYHQEYECSFEETEGAVFTAEMVNAAVTPEVEPLDFGGIGW